MAALHMPSTDDVRGAVRAGDATIPATDGLPLAATIYLPKHKPVAWCSLASANGVRRRFYRRFATFLAEQGIATVTFDYRGIGDSPATWAGNTHLPATPEPTMRMYGERDLEGVLQWIAQQHPKRIVHIGHSGGGQFLGLAPSSKTVEAVVVVASQSGYWKLWPQYRAKMWWLWHVLLPTSTAWKGHFPAPMLGMGEPLPKTVALEWARWCRHPDFIVDATGNPLREHFQSFTGRLRAISITDDDRFAPRRATEALLGFYSNADTEIVDVAPADWSVDAIGHFGYFKEIGEHHWPNVVHFLLRD
jgi:predicted alpha/beta hydrolase